MNRNFVKPREDMTPDFAPDVLEINGRKVYNPKAVHCKIAGYLPLSPDWPVDPPEGQHWERTDKIERDGDGYRWVYVLVDNPPPTPRTFSKYKLVGALMQAEVWPQVKAWIESTPGAYDLYLAAEDISEDEQLLKDGIDAVKELLGWTDEQVEAILAASVSEG